MREIHDPKSIQKSNMVIDCDEVLVHIAPKWISLMHTEDNFDYFNQFYKLSKNFDIEKHHEYILQRKKYYIDEWLIRKDVLEKFTIEEYNEGRNELKKLYDGDFYNDLQSTNLANSIAISARTPMVKKITIVSKTCENKNGLEKSKTKFLRNLFNDANKKVDIKIIDYNDKKSDVINKLDKIDFIYEDDLNNVKDIIDNCGDNINNSFIYIPSYGYNNDLSKKYIDKATKKGIEIKYYFSR